MLNVSPVSARGTEKTTQEILNAFVKQYFTGNPHPSKLGTVTFPAVDIFFNQTDIPTPDDKAQIHFVFTNWRPTETWFTSGPLTPFETELDRFLGQVVYGYGSGRIAEGVQGKLVRLIDGLDIRWQDDGTSTGTFAEQVTHDKLNWVSIRSWPDTDAIQWVLIGGNYTEQVRTDGVWTTTRTIAPPGSVAEWQASKKLVVVDPAIVTVFVRAANGKGDANATDFACRTVSDNFKELIEDSHTASELGQKGLRNFHITNGPVPVATAGYQTRRIICSSRVRYFLPRWP